MRNIHGQAMIRTQGSWVGKKNATSVLRCPNRTHIWWTNCSGTFPVTTIWRKFGSLSPELKNDFHLFSFGVKDESREKKSIFVELFMNFIWAIFTLPSETTNWPMQGATAHCGTIGRAVASDTRDPQNESLHRQKFTCQLYNIEKMKWKKKRLW